VVWVDGEWIWQGRRWAWKPGRWVVPPPNAAFAPWTTVRNAEGALFVAAGAWRDHDGAEVPAPEAVAVGLATRGTTVTAEGDVEPPSPLAPARDPSVDASLSTRAIKDAGLKPPEGGPPRLDGGSLDPDAELPDVIVHDADIEPDALPLPTGAGPPRMGPSP
jgi:hypothetical protein